MNGWVRSMRCFVSPMGRNKILDWYEALLAVEQADADEFIKIMRKKRDWSMPDYRPSLGGALRVLRGARGKSKLEKERPVNTRSKVISKLRNPEYRKAFVSSQINVGIPFQIRSLMKHRGWTQQQLADHAGMLQPRISAILKPGKGGLNIETLRRLAEAFDCGLVVRFAPFSELIESSERFDPESFNIETFETEDNRGLLEGRSIQKTPAPVTAKEFFEDRKRKISRSPKAKAVAPKRKSA